MNSRIFYGRRRPRIPLHVTAVPGGDVGNSDDEYLFDSDEESFSDLELYDYNFDETVFESAGSGKNFIQLSLKIRYLPKIKVLKYNI